MKKIKNKICTHHGGGAKGAYLLLYLWGNTETERGGVGKWNPVARSERDISGVHIIPMLLVCRASHFTSGRYSLTVYTQHCYAGMLGSILATV